MKKFFKILSLFLFCLDAIRKGYKISKKEITLNSLKDLWNYCKKWEEGNL